MHLRTTLVLAVLLGVFGTLYWLRTEHESENAVFELYEPLFGDLQTANVRGFRVDNLERSTQVTVESAGNGLWYVTDPVAYPAELSVVQQVLTIVNENRALPADRDPADVALDPPRAILEIIESVGGGDGSGERRHTLELGARDLGDRDVYVRRDGQVLLTRGNVEAPLQYSADYFREKRVVPLSPRSVIDFRRRGEFEVGGELRDLELTASLTSEGWTVVQPYRSRLDPAGTHFWLQAVCGLRVDRFIDDSPEDLQQHGLDPPAFSIELTDERSETLQVIFGRSPDGDDGIRCMRVGHPYVFAVDSAVLPGVAASLLDLVDYRIVRAERESVATVELFSGGRTVRVVRDGQNWRVALLEGEAATVAQEAEGDPVRVEQLLGRLETTEIIDYLPARAFESGTAAPAGFRVVTETGLVWGGELGDAASTPQGAGRLFRRFGEEVTTLVSPAVAELAELDIDELWSTVVHDLDVRIQVKLELTGTVDGEQRTRAFDRYPDTGLWFESGTKIEAPPDLAAFWVDPLLHMRSLAWVEGGADLEDAVEVVFTDRIGHHETGVHRFRLGRVAEPPSDERSAIEGGRVECVATKGRCEARADVYRALRELLAE